MRKNIVRFWTWFIEHETLLADINEENHLDILHLLNRQIETIHDDLIVEMYRESPVSKQKMIISADGIVDAFPAVIETIKAAPLLARWDFIAFRQPMGTQFELDVNGKVISTDELFYTYEMIDKESMGMVLYCKEFTEEIVPALFLALDSIIGEYQVESRLGFVEFMDGMHLPLAARRLATLPDVMQQHFPHD